MEDEVSQILSSRILYSDVYFAAISYPRGVIKIHQGGESFQKITQKIRLQDGIDIKSEAFPDTQCGCSKFEVLQNVMHICVICSPSMNRMSMDLLFGFGGETFQRCIMPEGTGQSEKQDGDFKL